MAGSPQQPTDRSGHGEEPTPQEGLDRGTRSLVLALALLSALFFAGAIALAVGTGMLAPSESQRERSALRPLPREWAGLDPLRPVVREPRPREGGGEGSGAAGIRGGGGGDASNGGGGGQPGPGPGGAGSDNAGPGPSGARPTPGSQPRLVSLPLGTTVVDSPVLPGLPDLIGGGPDLPDLPDTPGLPGVGGGGVSLPPIDVPRVPLPPIALPGPPAVVLPPIVPIPGGALPGLDPGGDGGVTVPPLLPTPELPTTPVVPPLLPLAADAAEAGVALVVLGGGEVDGERQDAANAREKPSVGAKGVDRDAAASWSSEGASVGRSNEGDARRERGDDRRWRGGRSTAAASGSGLGAAVARHVRCRLDRPQRHCRLDAREGGERRPADAAPDRGDDKPATGWRTRSRRGD